MTTQVMLEHLAVADIEPAALRMALRMHARSDTAGEGVLAFSWREITAIAGRSSIGGTRKLLTALRLAGVLDFASTRELVSVVLWETPAPGGTHAPELARGRAETGARTRMSATARAPELARSSTPNATGHAPELARSTEQSASRAPELARGTEQPASHAPELARGVTHDDTTHAPELARSTEQPASHAPELARSVSDEESHAPELARGVTHIDTTHVPELARSTKQPASHAPELARSVSEATPNAPELARSRAETGARGSPATHTRTRARPASKQASYFYSTNPRNGVDEKPACLLASLEGGAGETTAPVRGEIVSPFSGDEQQQSIALLTDPEIGFDRAAAAQLAALYPFSDIRAHVFRARRDISAKGRITSYGVIRTRLEKGYGATITEADRASPLWKRHQTTRDEHETLLRRYVPEEYADVIIH